MVTSFRTIVLLGTAGFALLAQPALAGDGHGPTHSNRGLSAEHQPVVSRVDYMFDAVTGPQGLAPGEPARLAGWFDGLVLGYGDTVTLADPAGWRGDKASDAVGMVLSRYGMLLANEGAPVTAGRPPAGSVRIVVSRASAHVEGCPDWSVGNMSDYQGATTSNYGCAAAMDLAAMIANPEDLVHGRSGSHSDADVAVKAIKSYRDAKNTGDAGLPGGVKDVSVVKTSGGN